MWQVYALIAHDRITERNREARDIRTAQRTDENDRQQRRERRSLLRYQFGHRA